LGGFLQEYGLAPIQLADCLLEGCCEQHLEHQPREPLVAAKEYISTDFPTSADVVAAANFMMAAMIATQPKVREQFRESFYEKCCINVRPTDRGLKEINCYHPLSPLKFITGKPVKSFTEDGFLILLNGEKNGLVNVTYTTDSKGFPSHFHEFQQLFNNRVDDTHISKNWNNLLKEVVHIALNTILFPSLFEEIRSKLESEAKENILRSCCLKLKNWLKVN